MLGFFGCSFPLPASPRGGILEHEVGLYNVDNSDMDLSPFSVSLLVSFVRLYWGRTEPLWALGCMGIGLSNIHILWSLLSLTQDLWWCNSLSSSSGPVTKTHGNFWVPLILRTDFEESPITPGSGAQPPSSVNPYHLFFPHHVGKALCSKKDFS